MNQEEVEGILERAGKKIRVILRPSILEELEKLKQDDYQIVLLSGAYENLLRACTYDLPFDHVIGSKLSFKDQVYRADAGLSMIEGRHKVQVIDRHFELGEQDWTQATAYGDSITDVELLHRVGNPVMVAPDEQLAQTGTERNWRRID
jgi:HAD superfamily phosphoserine phosphatase-like hydrolase